MRILLVEDDPLNQEVALILLENIGWQIDLANDGRQAVERLVAQPYQLILMDMQMPVMDGLEATRRLRRMAGYAATPILAMTANVYEDDRLRCEAAGMNAHLGKPLDPGLLTQALARWLDPAS